MASRRAVASLGELHQVFRLGAVGTWSDGQLLDRFVSRGDELAFEALVERHGAMVLRVCRAVLGDPHEALDAYQATFLILVRHARSIRRSDSVASWLHGVARRVASRSKRAEARRRVVESRASERKEAREIRQGWPDLHEAIDGLPDKYRAPIVLCGLEGYTHEEAAQQLGWPVGTVKVRLMRARTRLRERLLRHGLVPAALLVGTLASETSAAVAASSRLVKGTVIRGGVVPSRVALLADSTSRSMLMMKLRMAACALIVACGCIVATGWSLHQAMGARDDPAPILAQDEKPAPEKPRFPPAFEKRHENFRHGTFGNFRPLINTDRGVSYQPREFILYENGDVLIWNFYTKALVCPPIRHEGRPITEIEVLDGCGGPLTSLNPELKYLITRAGDSLQFWDGLTGEPKGELKGQAMNRHLALGYAPKAGTFATIGSDGRSASLWKMDTFTPVASFAVDSPRVEAVAQSEDGKVVVTFGADRSARLWDVASGKMFATLQPPSPVVAVFNEKGDPERSKLDRLFWETVRSLAPKGE